MGEGEEEREKGEKGEGSGTEKDAAFQDLGEGLEEREGPERELVERGEGRGTELSGEKREGRGTKRTEVAREGEETGVGEGRVGGRVGVGGVRAGLAREWTGGVLGGMK